MADSSIEWTDKVWNPVTGCSKVSQGCKNCYAEGIADRFFAKQYPPNADGSLRQFTDVRWHEDRLDAPLRWRKPSRVFVNSMSDLFHEDVPFEFILAVLAHAVTADRHTYQILTKRPQRAIEFFRWMDTEAPYRVEVNRRCFWWGVSVENQDTANKRIPLLAQFPVSVRWVSAEPLLGHIDFEAVPPQCEPVGNIDWVVVGAESGRGARPMNEDWVRTIRGQCQEAGVAFFYKQRAVNGRAVSTPELDGRKWTEYPA
jgi:protein gp37